MRRCGSPDAVQQRLRAASICRKATIVASVGIAFAAVGQTFPPENDLDFVLFAPVALLGIGAIAMGVLGLRRLKAAGLGRAPADCKPGVERLASRRAQVARRWAGFAIGIGVLLILVGSLFSALSWQRLKRTRHIDSLERNSAAQDRLWREVGVFDMPSLPGRRLPDSEIARRIRAFMADYPEIYTTFRIQESPQRPYPKYRRLISRFPADLKELTLLAVRDLTEALQGEDLWGPLLAAIALGDLPDPPPEAVEALRWAIKEARRDVKANARKALEKLEK